MTNFSIKELEDALVGGDPDAVRGLYFRSTGGHYFNKKFIKECIDALKVKLIMVNSGIDEFTPLEKLAATLLIESAGFDFEIKNRDNKNDQPT